MKKKLLSLVMVLAMALTLLPTAAFAEATTKLPTPTVAATLSSDNSKVTLTVSITTADSAPTDANIKEFQVTLDSAASPSTVAKGSADTNTADTLKYTLEMTLPSDDNALAAGKHSYTVVAVAAENDATYLNSDASSAAEFTIPDTSSGGNETAITSVEVTATPSSVTLGTATDVTLAVSKVNNDANLKDKVVISSVSWAKSQSGSGDTTKISAKNNSKTVYTFAADAPADTYTGTVTLALASGVSDYTLDANAVKPTVSVTVSDGSSSGGDEAAKGTVAISEKIYDEITHALTFKLAVTAPADDEAWTLTAEDVTPVVKVWTNSETSSTVDDVQTSASKTEIVVVAHLAAALTDGQKVTLTLTSEKLEGTPFDIPYTYKAPSQPTTPTTPTDTIPDAGNVTNSDAAESAIKNIQNSDADKIAEDVGKELTDTSSSASTATIDKLEALDQAVQDKAGITVAVSPDSKAPDALNTKKVSVVGAALNAEKTSNTKIELQISSPKTERTLGRTYDNDAAVQFSMTLTNVVSTKKLAVPVIISLPLPSGISSSRAVVLHYAGTDSASQVLPSKVSGGYISFVVTGFSDFIITQRAEKKTSTSGGGGGYSKVTNIPVTVTPNTPSTPAGIFTDVPANHSFASQITWARDNGVMGGYSDGSFRPTNPTNRQQLWMVLARLSGASPADMAAAREWAVNAGISDGTNGEGTLSRQQLVTMLYRYAQSQEMNLEGAADLSTYPDNGAVASYAGEALAWAVGKGIVTGTSDGRLNPEGTATRGQFAVMMYRFSHQG